MGMRSLNKVFHRTKHPKTKEITSTATHDAPPTGGITTTMSKQEQRIQSRISALVSGSENEKSVAAAELAPMLRIKSNLVCLGRGSCGLGIHSHAVNRVLLTKREPSSL